MPTSRPRHQVTETEDVARALDRADRRWPGETRSTLLVRLVALGNAALAKEDEASTRLDALDQVAGRYSGLYGDGYLAELRADWPE